MDSRRALQILVEQQGRISDLLVSARTLLATSDAADRGAMAGLRWQMMRSMRGYQLFKHQEIFGPLARSSDAAIVARASAMKDRCLSIGSVYLDHVERWSAGAASTAWDAYAAEARSVVEQIERHLTEEYAAARNLLRGVERTRQPTS